MASDIKRITHSNPVEMMSEREIAEETLRTLRSIDATLTLFLVSFSQGGARGLRTAVREHANGRG